MTTLKILKNYLRFMVPIFILVLIMVSPFSQYICEDSDNPDINIGTYQEAVEVAGFMG